VVFQSDRTKRGSAVSNRSKFSPPTQDGGESIVQEVKLSRSEATIGPAVKIRKPTHHGATKKYPAQRSLLYRDFIS
jgi:hypothetical protein